MLRAVLFSLLAPALVPALAIQLPLLSGLRWKDQSTILSDTDHVEWSFDKSVNPNVTDHLVFETVYSLLQHWPNARMRNGHNIVPGVIPKGTLLYHGTTRDEFPPGPEWVSFDPEHSHIFCRELWAPSVGTPQLGCLHLTLAVTQPLKVVYFDGSSAAKVDGALDAQDLLAWGEIRSDAMWDERLRIEDLCKWGKNFGVDGFVRMEMDFEVMLCDFTSGVNVVSFLNVVRERDMPTDPSKLALFEVIHAGTWHDRFPGETRIKLDLAGLVSFYDTQLVPSLVAIRADRERWDHRVRNISNEDLVAVKSRLEAVLTRPSGLSSGTDWRTLIQVIVDRFAGRLELTRHLLNTPAENADETLDLANKTQAQLRIMLTPYTLFSATPTDPVDKADLDWAIPIYKLCATTHTHPMAELDSKTDSEKLILQAVRGTAREICRVVTKMWAAGIYAGLDSSLNTKKYLDVAEVTRVLESWAEDLDQLTTWLDWSVWVKCNPACDPGEICYLPTWPIGFPGLPWTTVAGRLSSPTRQETTLTGSDPRTTAMKGFAKEMASTIRPEPGEWIRPQPKCITRVDPYDF